MADQLQLRGGTTAEHSTFTGALREVTVDTDKDTVVVHDGSTAGGHPLLRQDGSNSALALGTAGTPSIKFTGDTNTGIYSPGADQVAISTNGTGRLFVDASGNVTVDTNTFYVDAANNRVGIGLTTPAAKLELRDNTQASLSWGDTAAIGSLSFDGSSQPVVRALAGKALVIQTDGANERLRITSDGKVGVGTSSPGYKLDVGTTSDASNHINIKTSATGTASFYFSDTNNGQAGIDYNHSTDKLTIRSADATAMTIDSSQRVGVGTTSPQARLHIANETTPGQFGRILFDANVTSGYDTKIEATDVGLEFTAKSNSRGFAFSTGSTPLEKVRIDSSGRLLVGTSTGYLTSTSTVTQPLFQVHNTNANEAQVSINSWATGTNTGSNLTFCRSDSGAVGTHTVIGVADALGNIRFAGSDGTKFIEGASITASADGTWGADDGPSKLVFSTTADAASSPTERLRIDSSGRVGIGTTSPVQKLEVAESDSTTVAIRASNSTGNFSLIRSSSSTNELRANDTAPIIFSHTAGTAERARIDSSGRLLVGTSSARAMLGITPGIQSEGTSFAQGNLSLTVNSTAGNQYPILSFARSGGTTLGSNTIVSNGDIIGKIFFVAADGVDMDSSIATIEAVVDGTPGANDLPGRLVFSTTADGASSPTERMRITRDGYLFFKKTSTGLGTDGVEFQDTGGGARVFITQPGNGVQCLLTNNRYGAGTQTAVEWCYAGSAVGSVTVTSSSTAYNTSSDYRLKENITPVIDGITRLQQLKPSRFNFIADPDKTVDGFIAHEVQGVVPEAIHGEKDAVDDEGNPKYQGIDQSKLVPLLTAALQEAIGEIESLKARVAALESA